MDISFEICTEMLQTRGYDIIDTDENKILGENDKEERILAIFPEEPKLNISTIKEIINLLKENEVNHGIIIYKENITSSAKKLIESIGDLELETFNKKELQYNLTKHQLVPLHERVNNDDAREIIKKFGTKLPIILKTDAVSRFYNFKQGELIKISRKDGMIVYRIVR
jgi:DNA-directed RNA polymerase I, II, and III subunit RPABC1